MCRGRAAGQCHGPSPHPPFPVQVPHHEPNFRDGAAQARHCAGLCARVCFHLRADDLERRAVRDGVAHAAQLRDFRGTGAVRQALGDGPLVAGAEKPGRVQRAVCRRLHAHWHGAGHRARPEGACRRPAAHHLPVPDGAVVHRDRHGLEVDAQPQPGPGKAHARPGLAELHVRLAGAGRHRHLLCGDCRHLAERRVCHGAVLGWVARH